MKSLAELIVAVANLAEAEGRSFVTAARQEGAKLHEILRSLAVGLVVLIVAVPLLSIGACLVAAGIALWLEGPLGWPAAATITGIIALAAGGACVWIFRQMTAR